MADLQSLSINGQEFPVEKGTWTPVVTGSSGGTATCSIRDGWYVKCGPLLYCNFQVQLSSKNNMSGYVTISGMPEYSAFGWPSMPGWVFRCYGCTPSSDFKALELATGGIRISELSGSMDATKVNDNFYVSGAIILLSA